MSPIAIRPARPDDLDALAAIETAAFQSDRLSRRALAYAVRSPTLALLVAEAPGAVVGDAIVAFRQGSRRARLTSLAVAPSAVGRGIGRLLLQAAEREAGSRGCALLGLEVRADNAAAIRLYEAAGYRPSGRYDDYYEDGEAALCYERGLSPG